MPTRQYSMKIGIRGPSLSRRIVASVALGLGLILALYGLVSLWTVQESTEAAYQGRVALAQEMARHVDDVLGYAQSTLAGAAAGLVVESGLSLSEEQERRLGDLSLEMGRSAMLSVVRADGQVIWQDGRAPETAAGSPRDHRSVQLALSTGRPQTAEATSPGGTAVACLAVPLRDGSGRPAGVLMAELDPRHPALNLIPSVRAGDGMRIQLVSAAGQPLAGVGTATEASEHLALLGDLIATHTAGYRLHAPQPSPGGPAHLVAYAPVLSLPSWGIVVEQPKDVVVAAPRQLERRLAIFGLGALLIAVAVAWVAAERVVRPLKQLTAAAEQFSAGRLEEPITVGGGDELGILGRALETMRQRLRASLLEVAEWNRELEGRVVARTAEVERHNRERAALLQRVMDAQEEERRRVAQELHDETSQALASLQLGLERLAAGIEQPARAKHLAAQLQGIATETLAEVHRLAVELRPSVLDDVGLVAAIGRYVTECTRRGGLAVDFASVGVESLRLPPAAETAVYRIVQAALTNTVQHAQAQHASVLLERRERKLVVIVEDDGRGYDLDAVRGAPLETRLGLAGMEERAASIDAALTIETAPEAGTTIFLEVPLDLSYTLKEESNVEATHRVGR